MNVFPNNKAVGVHGGTHILNTESSTHTIVVKDSLCDESSSNEEEDYDDVDEDHHAARRMAEAPQFASGRKPDGAASSSVISESVNTNCIVP
jgi:hypothetical protein